MAGLPPPKSPSGLVKVGRWSLLALGIFYGQKRHTELKCIEDCRRAREEAERPAKEAAARYEKEKKSREEMAYLAQQAGVGGASGCKGPKSQEAQLEAEKMSEILRLKKFSVPTSEK